MMLMKGFAQNFDSLILFGGKGTRLSRRRKIVDPAVHTGLEAVAGKEGPKALALLTINGETAPLIDWQLGIHAASSGSCNFYLGLGYMAEEVKNYCRHKFGPVFQGHPLHYLIEKNPAGTLAPLIKMHDAALLTPRPLLLANGDNFLHIDALNTLREGLNALERNGVDPNLAVIDIVSRVDYAVSEQYGVLEIDHSSMLALAFKEKQPAHLNPFEVIDGRKYCWINSGFSIIVNPAAFFNFYVSSEVIACCRALENGEIDYKQHEKFVKYETLYEKIAAARRMVVVKNYGYWADSGTEEAMHDIEAKYRP
jgi:NDP-sugar pyrophosphorylase family protein